MKKLILSLLVILLLIQIRVKAMEVYKSDLICTFPFKTLKTETEYYKLPETEQAKYVYWGNDNLMRRWNFMGVIKNKLYFLDGSSAGKIEPKIWVYSDTGKFLYTIKTQVNKWFLINNVISQQIVNNKLILWIGANHNYGAKFNVLVYSDTGLLENKLYLNDAGAMGYIDKEYNYYKKYSNEIRGNLYKGSGKATKYRPYYNNYKKVDYDTNTVTILNTKTKEKIKIKLDLPYGIGGTYGIEKVEDKDKNLYLVVELNYAYDTKIQSGYMNYIYTIKPFYFIKISSNINIKSIIKLIPVVYFNEYFISKEGIIYQHFYFPIKKFDKTYMGAIQKWSIKK